ncbi:nucleotidyltransferase domain-containing protein [Beggiatoa alba]|nr:nucleotidyltransferase domain-containing protein [Beggiatoa alba]
MPTTELSMRLTPSQVKAIQRATTEVFGTQASVWLFGSRVDDNKRGGDIDLLVQPEGASAREILLRKIRFLTKLERLLGERKVDVVIEAPDDQRPIVRIAHKQGIQL